jgi:hypothetical protein
MKRASEEWIPVPVTHLPSRLVEPFRKTALLYETLLQGAQLLVQKVVSLVNQTNHRVGGNFSGRGSLDIGPIGRIGPILPITERAHLPRLIVFFAPQRQPVLAEVVLIIQEQFFQACTCNAYKLELGFLGCPGSRAAFGDVLFAAARRLHHLVVGA